MKKLFISQPMRDKTTDEIKAQRTKMGEWFPNMEIIDSFFTDVIHETKPLWYLGESLKLLSQADYVYFSEGWEKYRGCKIEHECAESYGIDILTIE